MPSKKKTEKDESKELNSSTKSKSIGDIVSTLADSQSEVSTHAIDAEKERRLLNPIDAAGKAFDPEFHQVDKKTGEPKLSVGGKLMAKSGRREGSKNKGASILAKSRTKPAKAKVRASNEQQIADDQKRIMAATATGHTAAGAVFTLGVVLGGSEWHAVKNEALQMDEQATLEDAFSKYFIARGVEDIPPGVGLAIALAGYAIPRLGLPGTQARIQLAGGWVKQKIKGGANGARVDTGDDRKRKVNPSKKDDSVVQVAKH